MNSEVGRLGGMALYARQSGRRTRQIIADALVFGWVILWALLGSHAWSAIMAVAEPARRTAAAAIRMRDDFATAGNSAAGVPVAGPELRRPFDSAAGSLDGIITASQDQVRTLESLAVVCGLLVFVLPVATVLVFWLPRRIRFIQRSGAVERLVDSGSDLDLFALRAIATQPMHELARISSDPVGDWRTGNWSTIVELAELELRSAGLGLPADLRSTPPPRLLKGLGERNTPEGS